MTDCLIVFNTCPDADTATRIANHLVDQRLASCVNVIPGLQSTYIWNNVRETTTECLLMIKTTRAAYDGLERSIREIHPYELPEVIAVSVDTGLAGYLSWIQRSVNNIK